MVDAGDMVDGVPDPGLAVDDVRLGGGRDMCKSARCPLTGGAGGIRVLCAAVDGHGGGICGLTDHETADAGDGGPDGSTSIASDDSGLQGVGDSRSFISTSSFS